MTPFEDMKARVSAAALMTVRCCAIRYFFSPGSFLSHDAHGGGRNLGLEGGGVDSHATCCLVLGSHGLTCPAASDMHMPKNCKYAPSKATNKGEMKSSGPSRAKGQGNAYLSDAPRDSKGHPKC
jgi:hypothetical protein